MRIYLNQKNHLVLAPDYFEKYGGSAADTVQIRTGEVTKAIEEDVKKAVEGVIASWQPFFNKVDTTPIFEEKKCQVRQFIDFETKLTEEIEGIYQDENYKSDRD